MINVENIVPKRDIVIVKLLKIEESLFTPDLSDEQNIAIRYGKVTSKGSLADSLEHCPGLEVGDTVVFTEFAGYYIPTEKDLYKAIRGYDIIGKSMKEINDKKDLDIIPTGDRVLVEIIDLTKDSDGLITNISDPRLADMIYGKIIKINPEINKQNLKVGQHVAFAPYAGTTIRNFESDESKELRIIVEHDILFTV